MELLEWVALQIDWIAVVDFMWTEVVVPVGAVIGTALIAAVGVLRKKLIEEIQGREELSLFSDILVGSVERVHKKSVDVIQEAKEDLLFDETIPEEYRDRIRKWFTSLEDDSNVKYEVKETSSSVGREIETDFQVQASLGQLENKDNG